MKRTVLFMGITLMTAQLHAAAGAGSSEAMPAHAATAVIQDPSRNFESIVISSRMWGTPKEIARRALINIVLNPIHANHLEALEELYNSALPENKDIASPGLRAIAKDPAHKERFDALLILWRSYIRADKDIARPILIEIAQNSAHKNYWDALKMLWWSLPDKDTDCPALRVAAGDPTNLDYPHALLLLRGISVPEDNNIAHRGLTFITQDEDHRRYWFALENLHRPWVPTNSMWRSTSIMGRSCPIIQSMAGDPFHKEYWKALHQKWGTSYRLKDMDIARTGLRAVAQDLAHKHHWDALQNLWHSDVPGYQDADKAIARPGFQAMAQNPDHGSHLDALENLWRSDLPADKNFVREYILKAIISRLGTEDLRQKYITLLRESTSPEDHKLAAILSTIHKLDTDDREEIKSRIEALRTVTIDPTLLSAATLPALLRQAASARRLPAIRAWAAARG